MKHDGIQKALIISGLVIIIAGFMLHVFAPSRYFAIYRARSTAIVTLMPALIYGITFIFVGYVHLKVEHKGSIIIVLILLILWNSGFAFVIYDFLTTPYGPEIALEHYSFIAQAATYPWIIANISAIIYLLHFLKHKRNSVNGELNKGHQ